MLDPPGAERVTLSIEAVMKERTEGHGGSDAQDQAWGGGREASRGWSRTSVPVLGLGPTPAPTACWDPLQRVLLELRPRVVPGVGLEEGLQGPPASYPPRPILQCSEPPGPHVTDPFPLHRAITLENTLVILSTVAPDAGRYYVQAVNDKNGDNKTSQPITLAVESK